MEFDAEEGELLLEKIKEVEGTVKARCFCFRMCL